MLPLFQLNLSHVTFKLLCGDNSSLHTYLEPLILHAYIPVVITYSMDNILFNESVL